MRKYFLLYKLRLTALVVFSAVITYLMADIRYGKSFDWLQILALTIGGFLVTGASNAFNQIIEKNYDKLMERTQKRPLPQKQISLKAAILFASLSTIFGLFILFYFLNPISGILGLIAELLYVAVYTPLKRLSYLAVLAGAIPGAIPPLLGWTASAGSLNTDGFIIFNIQFIWQFIHFWGLAWLLYDDYLKAGFNKMLPSSEGRTKSAAILILVLTALIIPSGLFPYWRGITGLSSAVIVTACGLYSFQKAIRLYQSLSVSDARKYMISSYIYLPVTQLALMFDTMAI